MSDKIKSVLKLHRAKLAQLYQRIQRTYDLCKDVSNIKIAQHFLALYRLIPSTVSEYSNVDFKINELEMELNDEFVPKFNDSYLELIAIIEKTAEELTKKTEVPMTEHVPSIVQTANEPVLPKINLPTFSGGQVEWSVFYELFKSLVHENSSLSDQHKVQYLVSKLTGEAANICKHLPPIATNYLVIWDALIERYNDPRSQINSYLEQIFEFKSLKTESKVGLATVLDRFCSSVTALKRLKTDGLDDLIFLYQGLKILDPLSRREFESAHRRKDMPTYNDFVAFIQQQIRSMPSDNKRIETSNWAKPNRNSFKSKVFAVQSEVVSDGSGHKRSQCLKCNQGPHELTDCRLFLKLSPWERYRFIKHKVCCLKCLSKNHSARDCKSGNGCSKCNKAHHSLLHFEYSNTHPDSAATDSHADKEPTVSCCSTAVDVEHNNRTTVLLSTVIVSVRDICGKLCPVRLLLDTGSQCHFLTLRTCKRLRLPIAQLKSSVHGFGGGVSAVRGKTTYTFFSRTNPSVSFSIEPLVVDHIVDKVPSSEIDRSNLPYLKELQLADDKFYLPGRIDGIIGAELVPYLLKGSQFEEKSRQLMTVNSVLGCILMGRAPILTSSPNDSRDSCLLVCNPSLDDLVRKFWEIENCPKSIESLTSDEIDCENQFKSSVRRLESGRFVVSLPFAKQVNNLGDSFEMASRRFQNLEKRLDRSPNLRICYHEIMLDYLRQGHMTFVENQTDRGGYYIPHHAIVKTRSTSTPLRIVFDASAKTTSGLSLNDILHVGPKLQTDIFVLLLNFRLFLIALTADIKQMYRQIVVDEPCRRNQRILWRFSADDPIEIYELNCAVFGVTSSPYLALKTVHQLVKEEGENFPIVNNRIPQDMFMDDLVTSVSSLQEADQLYYQSKKLFERGGFELVKWASNSSQMLDRFSDNEKSFLTKDFETGNSLAILGLEWQPSDDVFRFVVCQEKKDATKRNILSAVARIFDPLGLLAPLTLFLKCLIKQLWQMGLDWDEVAPGEIQTVWETCQREFELLSTLAIPRHIGVLTTDSQVTLIGFCDASELGYGAVIYLKTGTRPPKVSLLCGKSKVAPSKTLSIPRLELCAALLLSELINGTVSIIRARCHVVRVVALSDSTVTLHWIRDSPSRWQTFVANRVSKIQDSSIDRWMHVPGTENPADCLSRGLLPSDLIDHRLWWNGPTWLSKEENCWPVKLELGETESLPETKAVKSLVVVQPEESPKNAIYSLIERCSSYTRLLKIVVVILKFARLLPKSMRLGETELDVADTYLCRVVQKIHFSPELDQLRNNRECSPRIQRLSPFLDNGVIRVGGRLKNADLDFHSCHPIVLPKRDPFVTLLIDYYHRQNCHAGPHLLLSLLRQNHWILSAREVIRSRVYKCNTCFRCRPIGIPPKMGDLPKCRITQCKPFENSGVDYAGPIRITMTRRRNPVLLKSYICLFVCMATKAVHIELVSELSTQQFLAAFRRFLSRRGPCQVIYSDCGTNFVGANEQLAQLSRLLDSSEFRETLSSQLSDHKIEWRFSPPGSPHFGGIWEANVKVVKSHLFRVIGNQLLTYEELNTVLVQIEAVLNSRPLCPLSADPREPSALTPAHFLTLTPLKYLPMRDVEDCPVNRLTRYELLSQMIQSFWSRWRKEYLHELQIRKKWTKESTALAVGTMVIVDQPNLAPLRWPIGIIDEVFPGNDGVIRVAVVRTAAGRFRRSVTKLYPLPSQ